MSKNDIECTIDQELPDVATYAPCRRFMSTHQRSILCCMKRRHGCHLESVTTNLKSGSVCLLRTFQPNFIRIHTYAAMIETNKVSLANMGSKCYLPHN